MEQKKTRKDKALETKNRIFETAVALIKEKGYDNVTVSEICKTAGLAKGSFYVHYQSKEDIIRESYYADMGRYISSRYAAFSAENPGCPAAERIIYFLGLEMEFAEYAGHEFTCRAYALNLSACLPGPSEHFQKRHFSKILYEEIQASTAELASGFSCEDVFYYLESVVRGMMATWCFSNHSFDIAEQGKKFIRQAVYSVYPLR